MLFRIGGSHPPHEANYCIQGIGYDSMPAVLPGTQPLNWKLSALEMSRKMLEGAHDLIDLKIKQSIATRPQAWKRDFSSRSAYEKSVELNRKRFMHLIGVIDKNEGTRNYNVGIEDRYPPVSMQKISLAGDPEVVAETEKYRIYQVRWPVLNKVYGEGLLIQPKGKAIGNIIAIPDADQTPEQLAGLSKGIPAQSQFARRLAENGYQVLIPVLISRDPVFAGESKEQTYREWIYRQAFHMGRHVIGYEVQKVMAAVDWFKQSSDKDTKTGVAGYCEGGLIAMYAAAVDKRIDAVLVSGYFNSRENIWDEPIYRNVWGLLTEFGDAEIVSMIAPRSIVIEYSAIDEKLQKKTQKNRQVNGYSYTGYKGRLQTPLYKEVETEFSRIDKLLKPGFQKRDLVAGKENKPTSFGSASALETFTLRLGNKSSLEISPDLPVEKRSNFKPEERQVAQVKELEDHVQGLMRDSDSERYKFFLYKILPEFGDRKWSTKRYHPYF